MELWPFVWPPPLPKINKKKNNRKMQCSTHCRIFLMFCRVRTFFGRIMAICFLHEVTYREILFCVFYNILAKSLSLISPVWFLLWLSGYGKVRHIYKLISLFVNVHFKYIIVFDIIYPIKWTSVCAVQEANICLVCPRTLNAKQGTNFSKIFAVFWDSLFHLKKLYPSFLI